jgi:hypothetical protein
MAEHTGSASAPAGARTRPDARRASRDRRLHRRFAWIAGAALLAWGLSGLLHPLITLIGPAQVSFLGPDRPLQLAGARAPGEILAGAGLGQVAAVQVLATERETLLQATVDEVSPRRYFGIADGRERPDHDRDYAVFLARHYLGAAVGDVADATLQTDFDDRYPPVNRLLPVWRIQFRGDDGPTAWVYTETGVLALASNRVKERLQQAFALVHTWSWVPAALEWLRVPAVAVLVGSIALMGLLGLRLRLAARTAAKPAAGARRWHGRVAFALGVPVLMLAGSGLYHLLHSAANPSGRTLTLAAPVDATGARYPLFDAWPTLTEGLSVNRVSLVAVPDGPLLYRLGLARDSGAPLPQGAEQIRNARFDGVPRTGPALYLDALTGAAWADGDRELALRLTERFAGLPRGAVTGTELVTRFGPAYDFRNKRVPVWRIDYGAPLHASYFVDTATGVLADRRGRADRTEAYAFSYLHKWNFLMPTGRGVQNAVVVAVVGLAVILLAGLGLRLRWPRRRRVQAPPEQVRTSPVTKSDSGMQNR